MVKQIENIEKTLFIVLIALGAFLYVLIGINEAGDKHNFIRKTFFLNKKWTLLLYSSDPKYDSPSLHTNEYAKIEGFTSKTKCIDAGITKLLSTNKLRSFQCGYDCIDDQFGMVCEQLCDKSGCRE